MQASELNYFKEILENRKEQISKNIDGVHNELECLQACESSVSGACPVLSAGL